MNPRLVVEEGEQAGSEFEIPPEAEAGQVVLGRHKSCTIKLRGGGLSRQHCSLRYDGQRLLIEDLGSTNGTKVNDLYVSEKTELKEGDRITIGTVCLVVKYPEPDQEETPAPQPAEEASPAEESPPAAETQPAAEALPATEMQPAVAPQPVEEPEPAPVAETPEQPAAAETGDEMEVDEIDGYKLEEHIWNGAVTSIYRVRQLDNDAVVALKIIRPDAGATAEQQRRFVRGAKEALGLDHPNLVKVLKTSSYMELPYLISEYVEGGNLQHFLEKGGRPIRVSGALQIVAQLLAALQYLYEQSLVMRCVRPDNIIVTEGLNIKMTDYDLLKRLPSWEGEKEEITQTMDSGDFIDHRFAAPELIGYPAVADQRADVFGAGACLYFLLTLTPPFPESSPGYKPAHAFKRTIEDPIALNPKIPERVGKIIRKSMSEYLDKRYQTPAKMLKSIERAQKELQ